MAFEAIEPDPAEVTMHLTAELLALFHNVYRGKTEPAYAASDFLPDGNRQERLAQGTALMAQYAANHAKRQN